MLLCLSLCWQIPPSPNEQAAQGASCGVGVAGAALSVVINNLLKSDPNMTEQERQNRINLVTSLIAGIGAGVGDGQAAQTATNAAKLEIENNAIFLPIVLAVVAAMEVADKAITAYDAYQLQKAVREGDTDKTEEIATSLAIGLALEGIPGNKIAEKLGPLAKTLGESVFTGVIKNADEVAKRIENLPNKLNDLGVTTITPEKAKHILYGDKPGAGGHLSPGAAGKTPFPANWSEDKILKEVDKIIKDTNVPMVRDPFGYYKETLIDGVKVKVTFNRNKQLTSAFPPDLPRNPK